ncbi:uncharacterized protein MELLADRAFT_65843 [Melampsora larici-populina 98AG31]|uniref:Secreted protein n=1 Tax=Melampsora larici-populina (strain 98AG31 / pathotype 3-4-7) TaxID=747676 RepID=F4RWW9_MELLP|nr:uncharacterized protein MELLADRAFT_65843 [Melampsora larici-populina 98AG31]EGG03150.1 hypothetical protein MELLADRAFT_65843 [Melampsora larici-populina 98AG31]
MYSSSFRILVLVVLFYHSFINCRSTSKRELKMDKAKNELKPDYNKVQHVPLQDLRTIDMIPDLKTDGFTYVSKRHITGIENMVEMSNEHKVALAEDSVKLVLELTGAKSAYVHSGGFRDLTSPDSAKSIPVIHSDMSPEGATYIKGIVRDKFLRSKDSDKVKFGRYIKEGKKIAIVNVWRPIHTVQDNHLGICQWDSLVKEDAWKSNLIPNGGTSTAQAWRYREGQRWFYLDQQRTDEVYVFMQHDSAAPDGHGINVPHASFELQKDKDKPWTRISFEATVFAMMDSPTVSPLSEWSDYIVSRINRFIY